MCLRLSYWTCSNITACFSAKTFCRALSIPANLHRVQVEYELREKLALLRQHLLLASGNDSRLWDLLLRSVSSFATLFRHALIVLGSRLPRLASARRCRHWRSRLGLTPPEFCRCWTFGNAEVRPEEA